MAGELLHADVTDAIIKGYYRVYNVLGPGFLEQVYERSLAIALRTSGLFVQTQAQIKVYFEQSQVGMYFADLFVSEKVVVEVKAVERLAPAHEAQLVNYLRATSLEVGLLLNFGAEKPKFRRRVLTSDLKPHQENPR